MEGLKQSVAGLKDHVGEYAKAYKDLAKVKATKAASGAVSGIAIGLVSFILALLFLMLVNVGLALWIGRCIDSYAGGFFIMSGFYLLLIILLFALRKKVIVPMIRNAIISKFYEENN
jgi:hypothetical protein